MDRISFSSSPRADKLDFLKALNMQDKDCMGN